MYYTLPIFATLIWAGNTIVTKLSADVFNPMEISFYRWLLAFILLTPIVVGKVNASWSEIINQLPRLIVLGLLGGVAYPCIAYYAAFYTSATNMGIIQAAMPVMSMFLAVVIFNSRFKLLSVVGILISITGVIIVVTKGNVNYFSNAGINIGDLLMVLATFSFALYSFFLQKWKMKMPVLLSVYLQAIVASLILFPIYLFSAKHQVSLHSFSFVLYAGIAASILAPLVWMMGIVKLGSDRVSVFFNLVPVFTTFLAIVLLKEPVDTVVIVGGLISISGLVISEIYR